MVMISLLIGLIVLLTKFLPSRLTFNLHSRDFIISRTVIALFTISMMLLLLGLDYINKANKVASWNSTPCVITDIQKYRRCTTRRPYERDYDPYVYHIKYTYKVNNIEYTSDRYEVTNFSFLPSYAISITGKNYSKGFNTECSVNPYNPRQAILINGYHETNGYCYISILFIFSGFIFLTSFYCCLKGFDFYE